MNSNRDGLAGEELERRSFLRAMALGGAALSSGSVSGCVGAALQPVPVSPERAEREASRLTDALAQLDVRLASRRAAPMAHGFSFDDAFSPRALRALTYTGLVLDLPEEVRRSQPLVQLNTQLEEELDQTMMDALWVLAHSGDDARERFDRAVRNHPGFVMDYVESLDVGGAEHGLAAGSRMRLRRVASEINSRLRVESVDALLGDVTSKMARVMEVSGSDAAHRRLAVTRATQAIFATSADGDPALGEGGPADAGVPPRGSDARLLRYSVEHMDARFRRRRVAAYTLAGIGTLTLGIGTGVVVAAAEIGGAVAMTIGAVALVFALVMGAMTVRARRQLRRRIELEPTRNP